MSVIAHRHVCIPSFSNLTYCFSLLQLGVSAKQANSHDDNLDLDSILDDLWSFDPSKAVQQAQQQQQLPPLQNGHVPRQDTSPPPLSLQGQHRSPPTQPQPNADGPSSFPVRHTDDFQLPASLSDSKSKSEKPALTRKLSTVNRMNALPAGASMDEGKTVLIRSTTSLHSASDQVSSKIGLMVVVAHLCAVVMCVSQLLHRSSHCGVSSVSDTSEGVKGLMSVRTYIRT